MEADELDDDFGASLHAQMFELWVEPELERRQDLERSEVRQALVLMAAAGPRVLLNEEFHVIASVRATRAIEAGEPVTTEDYSEVCWARPAEVDPDTGWLLYAVVGNDAMVSFDLRSNLGRVDAMLDRAAEFLETATSAHANDHLGAAVDNALSAAELAVKAEVHLLGTPSSEGHRERLEFWAGWVRLGNAPGHLAHTFARLTRERGAARYVDEPLSMDAGEVGRALAEVREMVANARAHSSQNLAMGS